MYIILTRNQRFALANLFYSPDLKVDGDALAWTKTFNRTRLAAGLTPIMSCLEGKPFHPAMLDDTENLFELTDEQVDFLLEKVLPKLKSPGQAVRLGPVIDSLENYKRFKTGATDNERPAATDEVWLAAPDLVTEHLKAAVNTAHALNLDTKEVFSRLEDALAVLQMQIAAEKAAQ